MTGEDNRSVGPIQDPFPFTCCGCACLCDDLVVSKSELDRWLQSDGEEPVPQFWVDSPDGSKQVPLTDCRKVSQWFQFAQTLKIENLSDQETTEKVSRAVRILRDSKRSALIGLNHSSIQAIRSSLRLADRFGLVVDSVGTDKDKQKTLAFCQTGKSSSTWGEVGRNCESIVFWRCPLENDSRFLTRLKLSADKHRLIFLVGEEKPSIDEVPFLSGWPEGRVDFVSIAADDQKVLETVLLIDHQKDSHLSDQQIVQLTGNPREFWKQLLEKNGRQGWVVGELELKSDFDHTAGGSRGYATQLVLERFFQLSVSPFVSKPRYLHFWPGGYHTAETACQVLTWTTGFPFAVDFSDPGRNRFDPISCNVSSLLESGQVDALVLVDFTERLDEDPSFRQIKKRILALANDLPIIEIGPRQHFGPSSIYFPSSVAGIHEVKTARGGSPEVIRSDGVTVPIDGILPAAGCRTEEWIQRILDQDGVKE